jgi:hypothetical protein
MGYTVLILCGLFFSAFLSVLSCSVEGIFCVAGYDTGGGVCRVMGTLPVDRCAVSNVKIYGYNINGEYM